MTEHGNIAVIRARGDVIETIMTAALRDVLRERFEQIERHGFTAEHDLAHDPLILPLAALAYLETAIAGLMGRTPRDPPEIPAAWPFRDFFNPADPRTNLIKVGAFILAAIDRLDNSEPDASPSPLRGEGRGEGRPAETA